jgi:chemotaxis protein CheY-P-specific phosphatase CheC
MLNVEKKVADGALKTAFESGYKNAAASLAVMIKDNVHFNFLYHAHHPVGTGIPADGSLTNPSDSPLLVTTEIFGDVIGKSYLLLTQEEIDTLTQRSFSGKSQPDEIKTAFIKELDNILSAAVISKLSNFLGVKMYGDVPNWVGGVEQRVTDLIRRDFSGDEEELCISSACFTIDSYPSLRSSFIWVIGSKAIQSLDVKFTQQC